MPKLIFLIGPPFVPPDPPRQTSTPDGDHGRSLEAVYRRMSTIATPRAFGSANLGRIWKVVNQ